MDIQYQVDLYFNHLTLKLPVVSMNNKLMHQIVSKWQDKEEIYLLRSLDLHDMILDIIIEHPRAFEYREAVSALLSAETKYQMYTDHYNCSYEEWMKVRNNLLDLTTAGGLFIKDKLRTLGSNPTFYLDKNPLLSSYRCTLLFNKYWKSRGDSLSKKRLEEIKDLMLKDLWNNPVISLTTNPYLYSALCEHCLQMYK